MLKLLYILAVSITFSLHAQKEYNVWHFGNHAGLNFNYTPAKPFVDSSFSTFESSTSICDSLGNILFYTNGNFVMNKLGDTMKNGHMKKRHYSASQGSMALKVPNSNHLYLLILSSETEGTYNGKYDSLYYTVIDMEKDNGKGELIQKETGILPRSIENFAVARHANGVDYWIGALENNRHAFNLVHTQNGHTFSSVVKNPVVTGDSNYVSYCKFSPNSKILATHHVIGPNSNNKQQYICLYRFDNATGLLNQVITLNTGIFSGMPLLEFSPNSKLLYVKQLEQGKYVRLIQYDLTQWDHASISDSKKNLGKFSGSIAGLQIGPDGRLYVFPAGGYTGNSTISYIEYPDLKYPECLGKDSIMQLDKCSNALGGPYYPGFAFQKPYIKLPKTLDYCDYDSLVLDAVIEDADSFRWRSSSKSNSGLTIYGPGTYHLITYVNNRQFIDSVMVTFKTKPSYQINPIVELCQVPTQLSFNQNANLTWSTGEKTNSIQCYDTGSISLDIEMEGCHFNEKIRVIPCENIRCYVPEAFSVNGDLLNDSFRLHCSSYSSQKIRIYNAWGQLIFFSQDLHSKWDGTFNHTPCPAGVYMMLAEVTGMFDNRPKTLFIKTSIHLLR